MKKTYKKKYIHGGKNGTTQTSVTSRIKAHLKDKATEKSTELLKQAKAKGETIIKQKAQEAQESLIAKAKDKSDVLKESLIAKAKDKSDVSQESTSAKVTAKDKSDVSQESTSAQSSDNSGKDSIEENETFTQKFKNKIKNPIVQVKHTDEYIQKSKDKRQQIIEQKIDEKKTEKTISKIKDAWVSIFPEQDKVNKKKKIAELSIGAPYILLLLKMLFSNTNVYLEDDKKVKNDTDEDKE